ncbi:MAG: diphosphomevalonate decarboxylase [Tissierellia bacterium]|nr:diphosphomevalonate decarboxylase [Tissierellia bacterium]
MNNRGKARAYGNIALIKYWGKRDEKLILPMNSSLSLTIECFYTETEVIFSDSFNEDYFYLNGKLQDKLSTRKISDFIDLFRKAANINMKATVKSTNFVPTAAGLASSASGFAALAAACNVASGLNLDHRELSMYARQGSGSATRSIYGGFVEWKRGTNEKDSYAIPIDDAKWDIGMVIVIINSKEKKISSREGMRHTVLTSPFYKAWVESCERDIEEAKLAIKNRDFESLGLITERNGLMMHATMLGASPPFCYWEPDSVLAMKLVRELRKEGITCYFTMDAGPNVKILCRLSESDKIKNRLKEFFREEKIIITGPGPGIVLL